MVSPISDILEREKKRITREMDILHEKYKEKIGKIATTPISQQEGFDICKPEYIRKGLKYLPSDKKTQENYISDMLKVCATCAAKQRDIPKPKKQMTGWNCYLKSCAAEDNNMNFPACMQDKDRKEKEYNPNKDKWNQLALEGCPTD